MNVKTPQSVKKFKIDGETVKMTAISNRNLKEVSFKEAKLTTPKDLKIYSPMKDRLDKERKNIERRSLA